jgi:transcription initiation factor TFIIB
LIYEVVSEADTAAATCPACNGTDLFTDENTGETVCLHCGMVVSDDHVSAGGEWRAFTSEEEASRSRVGAPHSYTFYDEGLSTYFTPVSDVRGKKLTDERQRTMIRLKKLDSKQKNSDTRSRNYRIAFNELDRLASLLHTPRMVKENAALLYRKAFEADLIRGRSIEAFVSACLYAAFRVNKIPRSLKAVSQASTRSQREVAYSYRLLLSRLRIRPPIDGPFKFIPVIASELRLDRGIESRAVEILRLAARDNKVAGKNPRAIAAAALYLSCNEGRVQLNQSIVAEAAKTSEVTLRKRVRELLEGGGRPHD